MHRLTGVLMNIIWTVPGRRDAPPPLCGWGQRDGIWPPCESHPTWYWTNAWWAAGPENQRDSKDLYSLQTDVLQNTQIPTKISKLRTVKNIGGKSDRYFLSLLCWWTNRFQNKSLLYLQETRRICFLCIHFEAVIRRRKYGFQATEVL